MRHGSPRAHRVRPRLRSAALGALIALTVGPLARAQDASGIPWRSDFESALQESRVTGRPLWIQFTGPWCMFCRRMERETFSRPDVAALAREAFVPVRVDSEARQDLIVHFQVASLPTTIVLARDQQLRLRRDGYQSPEEFLAVMTAARGVPPAHDVALKGYDPVHLVQSGTLAPGESSIKTDFAGMEFHFRSPDDLNAFLQKPEQYTPCGGGRCLVHLVEAGQEVAGDPRFGVYYKGRLYLCADETSRKQFAREPEKYAQADIAAQGLCAHCATGNGAKVRGLPQFTTFYRGLRYLFPDEQHRQAFRSDPEKYVR